MRSRDAQREAIARYRAKMKPLSMDLRPEEYGLYIDYINANNMTIVGFFRAAAAEYIANHPAK